MPRITLFHSIGSIGRSAGRSLLAITALTVTGTAAQDAPAFPPAQVEVATAERREMAPVVDVSGTIVSVNDSRIASELEGVLVSLAEIGQAVEVGDVIAQIDPRLIDIALKRAQANVARLETNLAYREQQLKRSEELATNSLASATRLDELRSQRDIARHELADGRAQLERAEGDLQRTEIRAPFAGHITDRLAAVGEYVAIGEDIIRLVDTGRKEIVLPAAIGLAPYIRPGATLDVRNGTNRAGHSVTTVVPVGDAVSRMIQVRLDAADSEWLVGTPVQVSVPSDTPITAVAVPRDALVERSGQSFVYKVSADGSAEQVVAEIQMTVGLWVAIANGIEPGDQVVVRGGERLQPGQAVTIAGAADTGG